MAIHLLGGALLVKIKTQRVMLPVCNISVFMVNFIYVLYMELNDLFSKHEQKISVRVHA
jgi:hypothetical protein